MKKTIITTIILSIFLISFSVLAKTNSFDNKTLDKILNVNGNFSGTINIIKFCSKEEGEEMIGAGFIENKVNPVFTNGIRGGTNSDQIINSSGQLVGDINNTNSSSTNSTSTTLSVTGTSTLNQVKISHLTSGSIPFIDSNSTLQEDNSNIYWDDTNNRLGIGTTSPISELQINGLLTQEGAYCEIFKTDATSSQSIPTGTTYTKVTGFNMEGESKNCTVNIVNNKITITKEGRYLVNGSFSYYTGSANVTTRGTLFLDGIEKDEIHWRRKIGTATDSGSTSFNGIIIATSTPKDIDFRIRHNNGGSVDHVFEYANISILYIGEN